MYLSECSDSNEESKVSPLPAITGFEVNIFTKPLSTKDGHSSRGIVREQAHRSATLSTSCDVILERKNINQAHVFGASNGRSGRKISFALWAAKRHASEQRSLMAKQKREKSSGTICGVPCDRDAKRSKCRGRESNPHVLTDNGF